MSLFSKVLSLIIAQIVVIVACVYIHIDDLMPQSKEVQSSIVAEVNKEELQTLPSTEAIPSNTIPMQQERIIENPVVVEQEIEETIVTPERKEEVVVPVVSEKLESKQVVSSITDEKVKALFEKKKARQENQVQVEKTQAEPSSSSIDFDKIEQEIAQLVKENRIIFKRLSTDVTDDSQQTIEKIANIIKTYPTLKIEVGGHTDAKGDKEVNEYISKHRALSVKKLLVKYGVMEEQLTAVGYGESRPIVENDPQGYSILNRRVEFKVIKD